MTHDYKRNGATTLFAALNRFMIEFSGRMPESLYSGSYTELFTGSLATAGQALTSPIRRRCKYAEVRDGVLLLTA
jgi:hypothetical protein